MTALQSDNNFKPLFESIARSEEAAFKNLFELLKAKIYAVALKWTKSSFAAEEITQEVFISIWTSRAKLPAVNDPKAYLYTSVYNKVSRHLKKEANQLRILQQWKSKDFSNETEEMILANSSEKFISNAIEQLSPQKKLIYKLNRYYGKTYNEIGEALHLSPHTVKSHLMKALKSIRNYVKENAVMIAFILMSILSYPYSADNKNSSSPSSFFLFEDSIYKRD
jgi:RNA polymerase sigma-70 factor (family 1)